MNGPMLCSDQLEMVDGSHNFGSMITPAGGIQEITPRTAIGETTIANL